MKLIKSLLDSELFKALFEQWKTDFEFKTIVAAFGALPVTFLFACYNGFLGIYHRSLWYGAICIYYLILLLLRGSIVATEGRIALKPELASKRNLLCVVMSFWLLVLNLSLITPVTLMVEEQSPVSMSLIPAIAMAAYTFYKITMATINLIKRKQTANNLVRILRTIGFIDALVSILTLQNTLIMVNSTEKDGDLFTLTAVSSGIIFAVIMILCGGNLVKSIYGLVKKTA